MASSRRKEIVLEVEGLTMARGRQIVLERFDMTVEKGDLVALVGPNGAGKSTLFAGLLGLLPVSAGRFSTAGTLAYVPQAAPTRRAFPLSAFDVALMGAYARLGLVRPVSAGVRRRVKEALAEVGIEPLALFDELSAGQRRRVLVARALVQEGSVLLLDEPLSDVDATSERAILAALDVERARGRAVVMATHDLDFARRNASSVVLLNRRVFAAGSPSEVLTADALAAAYGSRLMLLDERGEREAFDEGSHHAHR